MNTYTLVLLLVSLITAFWQGMRRKSIERYANRMRERNSILQCQLDSLKESYVVRSSQRRERELCSIVTCFHSMHMLDKDYPNSQLHLDVKDALSGARLANFEHDGIQGTCYYSAERDMWEGRVLLEDENLQYYALTIEGAEKEFHGKLGAREHDLKKEADRGAGSSTEEA
ncbi:hypothetical protein [Achromobacter phage Motura]|uniref:Uncharacterized protein n=1 Tax=Achromobacter phage Motura TaxID=2591403 RepID=A0A514CSL3_9CAUD|nr:hypothetical protein H1O15_gp046 [Achromobacter phage Motura]QDH83454.1 hypothetical protein [Achromobacter phage Motura]